MANEYGTAAGVARLVPMHTDEDGDFTATTQPPLTTVEAWIDELSAAVNALLEAYGQDVPATGYLEEWLDAFVQSEVAAQVRATYSLTRRGPSEEGQDLEIRELLDNLDRVKNIIMLSFNQIAVIKVKYGDPYESIDLDDINEWSRID